MTVWTPSGSVDFKIAVLDLDTGQTTTLSSGTMDAFAEWRADGGRLVFTSFVDGDDEIYSTAPDGTNRVRLTNRAGVDSAPTYRSDGSIMFASDRSGALEIYTMADDGTGVTQLTTGAALTSVPRATDQVPLRVQANYKYDALGRLREITTSQGALAQTIRYGYSGPTDSHSYTTNSSGEIETANWSGTGGLIATAHANGGSYVASWYYFDQRGDTRAIADNAGQVTWSASYSEYGEIESSSGGSPQYGFVGAYGRISNPATGLIHMGARMYEPTLGRFLSRDPITGGSANDYEYTGGDPINRLDVSGTHSYETCVAEGMAGVRGGIQRAMLILGCLLHRHGLGGLGASGRGTVGGGSGAGGVVTAGRGGIDWPELGGRWAKRGLAFAIQPWHPKALTHGEHVNYADVARAATDAFWWTRPGRKPTTNWGGIALFAGAHVFAAATGGKAPAFAWVVAGTSAAGNLSYQLSRA